MLRDTTEWVKAVGDGWNVLVGTDEGRIVEAIKAFSPRKKRSMIFGEVGASGRIVGVIGEIRGKMGWIFRRSMRSH